MTIPERRANNNSGYCECGCGKKTTVAKWNDLSKGYKVGEPRRFLNNHYHIWMRSQRPDWGSVKRGERKRKKQLNQIRSFIAACIYKNPLSKAQIHVLVAAQGYDLPRSQMLSINCERIFRRTDDDKWVTDRLPAQWSKARLKKAVDDAKNQISRHKDLPWFVELSTPLVKRKYCRHCSALLSNTRKIWCERRCRQRYNARLKPARKPRIPLFDPEQRLRQERYRGDADVYTVLAINAASSMSQTRFSECVGPAYVAILYAVNQGITDEAALILCARRGMKRHWNRESDYAVLSLDTMKEVHAFEPAA